MQKGILLLIKRTMTLLVVVSFLLQPLAVMAEEVQVGTSEKGVEISNTSDVGNISESTMEAGEMENTSSSGNNTDFHKQEGLMQNDKKNVKTSGQFLVDNFSGAATYSYSFDLPEGRNGFSPKIGLSYNSHGVAQTDSIVGSGWNLSQSNITRQNKAGTLNMYSSNDYVLQLFGEQIELVVKDLNQGEFVAKVENEFLSIKKTNNGWEVQDKSGILYIFGDDSLSRQSDPDNQQNIYRWWLKKIIDTNGNQITYDYYADANQLYPRSINYTSNGNAVGEFEVRFQPFYDGPTVNDVRPDDSFSYISQFKILTKYRLKNVEVFNNSVKKSSYSLEYIAGQNGKISLLNSIQKTNFGSAGAGISLPKTSFEYSLKQPQYTNVSDQYPLSSWAGFVYAYPWESIRTNQLGDLNSDSWLDRGSDIFDGKKWITSNIDYPFSPDDRTTVYGDFNGDGKNDFIDTNLPNSQTKMWLNNGNNFISGWTLPPFFYPANSQWPISQIAIADVNSDGLSDIIYAYKQYYNIGNPISIREIWLNTGSGFIKSYGDFPIDLSHCDANILWRCHGYGVELIDVNSDGLVDVWTAGGVYLNTGKNFSQTLNTSYALPIVNYGFLAALNNGGAKLVDVNSDGLIDVVENYDYYSTPIINVKNVYLNTGKGFIKDNSWNIPIKMSMTQNEFYGDYGVRLFDINNDGGFDVVSKGCADGDCGSSAIYQHVVYASQPGKANLLKNISVGVSRIYDVNYQQSATITDEQGSWLNNKLSYSLPVVKSVVEYDGLGGSNTTSYEYAYGFQYVDRIHPNDSQFAGFGVVTIDNNEKQIKDFFHQGGGFDGGLLGEDSDIITLKGRLYREEIYKKEGQQKKLEKITINKWKSIGSQNSSKVFLENSVTINDKGSLENSQQRILKTFKSASSEYIRKDDRIRATRQAVQKVNTLTSEKGEVYYLGKKDGKYEYKLITNEVNNSNYSNSGYVERWGEGSWQKLVNGTGGYVVSSNHTYPVVSAYTTPTPNGCVNPTKRISRGYLSFDTSLIPDGATLASSTLKMMIGPYYSSGPFPQKVHIVRWNTENPSTINNDDYNRVSGVSGGWVTANTPPTGTPLPIVFNSEALNWISVSTSTNLALRYEEDLYVTGPVCIGQNNSPLLKLNSSTYLETNFFLYSPYTTPTNLMVNGYVNPETIKLPITFGAEFHAESSTSTAKYWRVQITNTNDFADAIWDSGKRLINGNIGVNQRVDGLLYDGPSLSYDGKKYKVRIKFWDNNNNEGTWSEEDSYFYSRLGSLGETVNYEYDQQNNRVIKEINRGKDFVDIMTGELINEIPGDEQTTNYDYAESVSNRPILTAVKRVKLVGSDNNQQYITEAQYDNLPLGQVSKNNKTKDDLLVQQINVQTEYNEVGLPKKQIDPLGKITTIDYGTDNLYPVKTTNASGQETTFVYDKFIGQPTLMVDANGGREEKSYDAFGRALVIKKSSPDNKDTMIELEKYTYDDLSMPRSIKKQSKVDNDNWLTSVEYFDGLGRTVQTRVQHSENNYVVISNKYDQFGRVVKTTLPYLSTGPAYETESWNRPVAEKQYDSLDRVIKEINPAGTTNYKYDGFITTITDAKGIEKKLEHDAYGRLVAVEENINNQPAKTKYSYNALGKLTRIVDSQNNIRNFVYDGLGRLLSQEDMHSQEAVGPVWHYDYDKNSHLIKQIDPRGLITTYDYDDLGRVVKEKSNSGEINYTYDVGTNAIGKLVKVTSTYGVGYEKVPTYDAWGRVVSEDVTIETKKFTTSYKYTLSGNLAEVNLPNLLRYQFGYDAQAKLQKIDLINQDNLPVPIIASVGYHVSGRPGVVNYSNGAVTNYVYDDQTQRLINKKTISANSKIQDLNYTYDSLGNITELLDSSETPTAKLVKYGYDTLSRLIYADATQTADGKDYKQTYQYDAIGNILNKSDVGEYKYGKINPYQVANINGVDYSYDLNGNVINDGLYIYSYNSANRLASAVKTGQSNEYSYDPSGTRIFKKVLTIRNVLAEENIAPTTETVCVSNSYDSAHAAVSYDSSHAAPAGCTDKTARQMMTKQLVRTYYPNQYYEVTTVDGKETSTAHVYGLGQRLAQIDRSSRGQDIKLIFTDHLGSTQVITNQDGKIVSTYDYYPFGGVRLESSNGTNKQFSGKIKDETNLNYFEARYLDGDKGRFNEVDSATLNIAAGDDKQLAMLTDPQRMNAYGYALNSPIINTDTTGNFVDILADIGFVCYDLYRIASQFVSNGRAERMEWAALGMDTTGALVPGVTGLGAVTRAISKADDVIKVGGAIVKAEKSYKAINSTEELINIGKLTNESTGEAIKFSRAGIEHVKNGHIAGINRGNKFTSLFSKETTDKQLAKAIAETAVKGKLIKADSNGYVLSHNLYKYGVDTVKLVVEKSGSTLSTFFGTAGNSLKYLNRYK